MDEHFVCKKYVPYDETMRPQLFENFKREIKILHRLQHPNIVRVFGYFLYPAQFAGYILMEFIEGSDVEDHIARNPESAANIFRQALLGFQYLETNNVLHRDIRPGNLLVSNGNRLKIIDFGFGKEIQASQDFDKSVSLNWWCDPPAEFGRGVYDFRTEVYFVGKLFQKILSESGLEEFEYSPLLSQMCAAKPGDRIPSFSKCRTALLARGISDPEFNARELAAYRVFANDLHAAVSKLESGTKYLTDPEDVLRRLEALYSTVMLEEYIPNNTLVIRCFLDGTYYYSKDPIETATLHAFIIFFRSCSKERRNIVLSNLHTRLDSLPRYSKDERPPDDDIPF